MKVLVGLLFASHLLGRYEQHLLACLVRLLLMTGAEYGDSEASERGEVSDGSNDWPRGREDVGEEARAAVESEHSTVWHDKVATPSADAGKGGVPHCAWRRLRRSCGANTRSRARLRGRT